MCGVSVFVHSASFQYKKFRSLFSRARSLSFPFAVCSESLIEITIEGVFFLYSLHVLLILFETNHSVFIPIFCDLFGILVFAHAHALLFNVSVLQSAETIFFERKKNGCKKIFLISCAKFVLMRVWFGARSVVNDHRYSQMRKKTQSFRMPQRNSKSLQPNFTHFEQWTNTNNSHYKNQYSNKDIFQLAFFLLLISIEQKL